MILTVRSTVIRLSRWEGSLLYVYSSDIQNNSAVSNADSYGPELKRKAERIAKLYKVKIATSFPPSSQREIGSSLVDLSGCEGVRPLDRYDIVPINRTTVDVTLVMSGTFDLHSL